MQIGSLRLDLNIVTILTLITLVLSIVEVIRTWGVVTRPLSFAVLALVVLQVLWLLGVIGFPGSSQFASPNVWLAIVDAALIPMSVALAGFAIGKKTVPIASAIGLLAFVQLLIVSGIVRVTGLA
ncbi:MAG: hypothetical protein IPO81_13200 [Kouleothrix sp.]|nr:hypothetical protein [Kouleothrix sp.]